MRRARRGPGQAARRYGLERGGKLGHRAARAAYTPGQHGWIQVDCTLFPQGLNAPLYVPWAALRHTLEQWCQEDRFTRCFFMRKPPGLRLRFQGAHLGARLEPMLVAWLEEAEQRNDVRGFRFAVYEPERFRFGGPAGMDVAHDYFDRDSGLILRYETLSDEERATLPRDLYSLIVSYDLFCRCVDDGAEVWDVWERLQTALGGGLARMDIAAAAIALDRAAIGLAPAYLATLPPAAKTLLEDAQLHNAAISARLHAAAVAGRLAIGTRAWLAAACVFHWNRLALPLPELRNMVARMHGLLNPEDE